MSVTCSHGHTSDSTDYCDTCGVVITAAGSAPAADSASAAAGSGTADAAPAAPAGLQCRNCGANNLPKALFCEVCGYDFTTGSLPPPADADVAVPPPAGIVPPDASPWVVELWVDPDWYATQDVAEPCPSPGPPTEVRLTVRSALVGRYSASRGITPQVDAGADSGVSRRHCQLTTDGTRWWVEDLQSSNGTYVGAAGSAVPHDPIVPGQRRELADGDRILIGAWTRLVVRRHG